MEQHFYRFRADTFEEAYQQMVHDLGRDAVVVNTAEVKEAGLRGLLGRTVVELTARAAGNAGSEAVQRRRSLVEKKYAAQSAAVGSDANVQETIAFFKQMLTGGSARAEAPAPEPLGGEAAGRSAVVLPFRRKPEPARDLAELRREIRDIRKVLDLFVTETPSIEAPPEFAPHYRSLVDKGVARELASALVTAVVKASDPVVLRNPRFFKERLRMEVQKRVAVTHGVACAPGARTPGVRRTVAFVGPTGVGKTTNLAKLAADLAIRERARVALVTMDTYRVAAPEQLRAYAGIIGVPLYVADDAADAARAMQSVRDYDFVLIDTAGVSQFNAGQLREIQASLDGARPDETMLVLSANTQVEDLAKTVANFACQKPTSLLFSKLDETERFGSLFSIAATAGLPLSYLSYGQNVPDDMERATPSKVAKLLLENGGRGVGTSTASNRVR